MCLNEDEPCAMAENQDGVFQYI